MGSIPFCLRARKKSGRLSPSVSSTPLSRNIRSTETGFRSRSRGRRWLFVLSNFLLATKENLRKVLEYETSRFTPFEKGETYFDYQLLKEEKDGLHLLVAFVKKAEVDYHLTLLKKVGIQPLSIQIPSVAALNLFYLSRGAQRWDPTILLDVAEPFVELNLLREGEWVESFHLPLPPEEKASRIVNLLKRMGLKDDSLSKSTFFVYGSGAEETWISSLKATPPIKEVLAPPLHRLSHSERSLESRQDLCLDRSSAPGIDPDPVRPQPSSSGDEKEGEADRETSLPHPDGPRFHSRDVLGDRHLSAL